MSTNIYPDFVFPDKLVSPVNGYTCKRITKQTIRPFGFLSKEELLKTYPEFPIMCEDATTQLKKAATVARTTTVSCKHCSHETNLTSIKHHELNCYLNPVNVRPCPVCSSPIKDYKNTATCSHACSNTLFRSGPNNGSWKETSYRSTCFHFHKKECVVCGESNIVTVHHLDENKNNNSPNNLIPMCPTHHQYWHSRFRHLVEDKVMCYVTEWKSNNSN